MEVESALQVVGTGGPFQIALVLTTQATRAASLWGLFYITFGIYEPPWMCVTNATTSNLTSVHWTNANLPANESACDKIDQCESIVFEGGSSTLVTEWLLICDNSWITGTLASIQMMGFCVGAMVSGQTSELFGRKTSVYGYLFMFTVANVVSVFSSSWQMYAVLRFILGFSVAAVFPIAFVYAVEFLGPKGRSVLTALPVWNVGVGTFSVVAYFIRDWRYLHIATAVFAGLSFLPVFWTPESIRWLFAHGKIKEANDVACRIGRMNKKGFIEDDLFCLPDKKPLKSEDKKEERPKYTYISLFKDRKYAIISCKICFMRLFVNIVYFVIGFGIKNFPGDFYVNFMIYSVSEIPIVLFVAPVLRCFTRRFGIAIFSLASCISCFLVVILCYTVEEDSRGYSITALALIAKTSTQGIYQVHDVFIAELFPTVIRGLSVGLMVTFSNLGGVLAPFLIPNTPSFLPVSFSVMGVILALTIGINLTLPETKGRPLEDVIVTIDID